MILIPFHGAKKMNKGTLYLLPSPLTEEDPAIVLPESTLNKIRELRCFIVEEVRTARRFLIRAGAFRPDPAPVFMVLNEHTPINELPSLLKPLTEGTDTGLLSEAGVPCVADPGALVVREAHSLNIRVVPMTGPSSILLSLMASGFNGQNFAFTGYITADRDARRKKLKELDHHIRSTHQTQIMIETPYRNMALFDAILACCHPSVMLCLATDLTGANEQISVRSIAEWKTVKPGIHKKNTIFLLHSP